MIKNYLWPLILLAIFFGIVAYGFLTIGLWYITLPLIGLAITLSLSSISYNRK